MREEEGHIEARHNPAPYVDSTDDVLRRQVADLRAQYGQAEDRALALRSRST
ncbi:Hypothetical protein CAP_2537 [Chondromyces apiculatus DSM 436]|uniref:Uncharacterized protein n=1 Tax=Chondromyces apiculatus DSM 436 TaxID=1192034 RepID=A0A017TJ84_9BACT|nr:Hypothetical protein CAP_2537 [Chondromyces apiculatus DSM 436]